MDLSCEERPSDSPFVETVWRSRSEEAGNFISIAQSHWGMVVTKYQDKTVLTVRGPETHATPAYCPPNTEFFGIQFKTGAVMTIVPVSMVIDRRDLNLPEAGSQSFWLNGSAWDFFDYENADTFVDRLVRDNLLYYEPVVDSVLQGKPVAMSIRTVQRRFLQTTGLTHGGIHKIERALYATKLLKEGISILDTVEWAGYSDQPHLTRSLKHLIGQTPAQLLDKNRQDRLSFLFKNASSS